LVLIIDADKYDNDGSAQRQHPSDLHLRAASQASTPSPNLRDLTDTFLRILGGRCDGRRRRLHTLEHSSYSRSTIERGFADVVAMWRSTTSQCR
jgi:hypothetical protein